MAVYKDFPGNSEGIKARKAFWLSDEGLTLMGQWRRQGIPLEKIAKEFVGVSRRTFFNWLAESDKMKKVLNDSIEVVNASVEEALLKRALGYEDHDDVWELVEGELKLVKSNVRNVPPDVKACLNWLFNRRPDRWRAIQEPLEKTQYIETVQNILVAMKKVAESGNSEHVEVKEDVSEATE